MKFKIDNKPDSIAIREFLERHADHKNSILEGTVTVRHATDSGIHSLRLEKVKGHDSSVYLIKVLDKMIIPAVGLTQGDKVYITAEQHEDATNEGYNGYLRELANTNTGRVYRFEGDLPDLTILRVIDFASQVREQATSNQQT